MNTIAIIILAAVIFDFALNGLADYLNLTMLRNDLPESFRGVYDSDRYRKSQQYLKVNTRFGWFTATFNVTVILIFWFAKGFPLLDEWVRSFNYGPVITGLIYMAVLVLLKGLLSLPFSIYATFVIEERFGFNQTSWATFMADLVKGLLLAVLLGAPLLTGILAFFVYAGTSAWWYCWIAVTIYMLGVQFIAPTWIMPLFNKFKPLEDGELKAAILSYAGSINFPIENVFVMDGSRRSSKSNAFFSGFGKHRRIVLFDTLIKQHTTAELLAVLAHEMGHYKKKHIFKSIVISILSTGLMFGILSLFINNRELFAAFKMQETSIYASLLFFGFLYSPIQMVLSIFGNMLSRRHEYDADEYAVKTYKASDSMIAALKKLSVENLSNLTPHPLKVFLSYSHPPVLERIQAIRRISSKPSLKQL